MKELLGRLLPAVLTLFPVPCNSYAQQVWPDQLKPLSLSERSSMARPLLVHAEAVSKDFDPTTRSLLLYRVAGAWLALDPPHAVRLYRDAFAWAREAAITVREPLQEAILNELLPLSPSDVIDLLPRAEKGTQDHLYAGVIKYWLFQGDVSKAVIAFDSALDNGTFPEEATVHLVATLPKSSSERTRIFLHAADYCRRHPTREEPLGPSYGSLAHLIARFHTELTATVVLRAIDIVLAQAEEHGKERPASQLGWCAGNNCVSFHSDYDVQLFAVAPALQQLDAPRAADLLLHHPDTVDALKRYPNGLASFAGEDYSRDYSIRRFRDKPLDLRLWSNPEDSLNLSALDMGLEFTIPRSPMPGVTGGFYLLDARTQTPVLDELKPCLPDFSQKLDLVHAVPAHVKTTVACSGPLNQQWCSYDEKFPRADTLQFLAEGCSNIGNSAGARAALRELIDLLNDMPDERRVNYLAKVADLYLRLGDEHSAATVIDQGFQTAQRVHARELGSQKLKNVPEGVWSSAEIYRRMVTLGANASLENTRKAIDEIGDPGLRVLEEVMLARALLGIPVRRYVIVGAEGGLLVGEGTTYDRMFR